MTRKYYGSARMWNVVWYERERERESKREREWQQPSQTRDEKMGGIVVLCAPHSVRLSRNDNDVRLFVLSSALAWI